jgi:hypothetical protein
MGANPVNRIDPFGLVDREQCPDCTEEELNAPDPGSAGKQDLVIEGTDIVNETTSTSSVGLTEKREKPSNEALIYQTPEKTGVFGVGRAWYNFNNNFEMDFLDPVGSGLYLGSQISYQTADNLYVLGQKVVDRDGYIEDLKGDGLLPGEARDMAQEGAVEAMTFALGPIGRSTKFLDEGIDVINSMDDVVESTGWLNFHEDIGHTIARHVDKTDAQLISRLNSSPRISGASSFTNQSTAESVISSTIALNRAKIRNWLKSGSTRNLVLEYTGNTIIGRGVMRGQSSVSNLTNARVILKPNGSDNYKILTAFPR